MCRTFSRSSKETGTATCESYPETNHRIWTDLQFQEPTKTRTKGKPSTMVALSMVYPGLVSTTCRDDSLQSTVLTKAGHYLHTPEQQTAQMTSSPEKLFLSSPSYQASQNQQRRRQNQHAPYLRAMTREHVPETPRRTHNIEDPRQINLGHAPPLVQGIQLVSPHQLPDKFRSIFPYPTFNAVQSKCFSTIYDTDENFVLSAPTGSGKTGVLELAICRLVMTNRSDSYKIVYMAPTKSLCAERQRDWQAKFQPLSIKCAELTGDTDHMHLRQVQTAGLIITTPEKWDSITRKWKDHVRLMQMIKLLL